MTDQTVDLDALARQAVAEKAILGAAEDMHKQTRQRLEEVLRKGERVPVWTPDEVTELGYVQLTKPKPAARVTSAEDLLAWVEDNYPEEVEVVEVQTVRRVRPAFAAALVKAEGVTPDGEVVPGIELVQGSPTLRVVPTAEAKSLAADSVRSLGEVTA